MFSLLYRTSHHVQSSLFNSIARPVAFTGRAHSTSTTGPEWTPTRVYASKSSESNARRFATDPESRERKLAYMREWRKKNRAAIVDYCRAWRQQNPDKQEAKVIKAKSTHNFEKRYYAPKRARWASDFQYRRRENLAAWLRSRPQLRDLTWRTHKPIHSEKIVRWCEGCKINRSLKLWWQDNKKDEFLCHPCFTSDWSRALPIGYEDKVFGRK
jgi:hypothetical protein